MMRRADFKAIAEIIREYKLVATHEEPVYVLTTKLCQYFRQSNPTFDKGKFLKNCGFYQES